MKYDHVFLIWTLLLSLTAHAGDPFQEAKAFTVRVSTSIPVPFKEDSQGSLVGTAFLIDAERGWLLTNAHVSGRSPAAIRVSWEGQDEAQELQATLVYADILVDLAVIAVDPERLPGMARSARLACDSHPSVGMAVGAYGHPRGEYFRGARGIVSGLTSSLKNFSGEFIHIDTPINPGNSGGPVIDLGTGRIVGVVTAGKDSAQGMNYALQIYQACKILDLLLRGADPSAKRIPVAWVRAKGESRELRVARVLPWGGKSSPLRERDQVVRVIGGQFETIHSEAELAHELRGLGSEARVEIDRPGVGRMEVTLALVTANRVQERVGYLFSGIHVTPVGDAELTEFEDIKKTRVMVAHVLSGGVGDAAGVETTDRVVAVNGKAIRSFQQLRALLDRMPVGTEVELHLRRLDFYQGSLFGDYIKHVRVTDRQRIGFTNGPARGLSASKSTRMGGR